VCIYFVASYLEAPALLFSSSEKNSFSYRLKIPCFQRIEAFLATERTQGLGDLYLIFVLLEKREGP